MLKYKQHSVKCVSSFRSLKFDRCRCSLTVQALRNLAMDYHRLLAEEGSSLTDEKIDLRRRQSKWRSPSNIALLVLSATTLISTLALLRIAMFATPASCPVEEHFTSSYGKHEDRMSLDHKFDYAWEEALTPAWGVIMIDQEGNGEETKAGISMYALPKNLALFERAALRYFPSAEHPDLTSMSRMHQLHCLASFHRALQEQHDGKDIGLDQNDDIHWPHCFDYLYEVSKPYRFPSTISPSIKG